MCIAACSSDTHAQISHFCTKVNINSSFYAYMASLFTQYPIHTWRVLYTTLATLCSVKIRSSLETNHIRKGVPRDGMASVKMNGNDDRPTALSNTDMLQLHYLWLSLRDSLLPTIPWHLHLPHVCLRLLRH